MRHVLKRKQTADNATYVEVWENIEEYVSRDEIDARIVETLAEMDRVVKGRDVAYGWSGGKESQVLAFLCDLVGVRKGMLSIVSKCEFPSYLAWVDENIPSGIEIVDNDEITLSWLNDNPKYLFPSNSKDGTFWDHRGTWYNQHRYYKRVQPDMIIYGRTRNDGNYIHPQGFHHNNRGELHYVPLREWVAEEIMGCCHYYALSLPPIYFYTNGWVSGTGPWTGRQGFASKTDGWQSTWDADPNLVIYAAQHIESGQDFLDGL